MDAGKAAAGLEVVRPSDESNGVYYLHVHGTDKYEQKEAEIPPRNHAPQDLASFMDIVGRFASPADGTPGHIVSTWFGSNAVVAILDDGDGGKRREKATMRLMYSLQFDLMRRLADLREAMDQKKLLRLLRVDLAGCVQRQEIDTIKKLKFTSNSEGESTIEHGKESMGRRVEQEVAGVLEIPEQIIVSVPVYSTAGEDIPRTITCALEIDMPEAAFYLIPLPLELEHAKQAGEESIGERLRDRFGNSTSVHIYRGAPTGG